MNTQEKLALIETLAARMGWLVRAYAKREELDTWNIEHAEFAHIQFEYDGSFGEGGAGSCHGVNSHDNLRKFATTVQSLVDGNMGFARLEYDFIEGRLTLDHESHGGLTPEAAGYVQSPERLLEFFEEADIRRAFAEHESSFFKETNTTAEDWRLEG
jgi:hypothetical protein